MNILKILGIVAGIHVVAFFIMFVNPGCRSSSAAPSKADTLPPPVAAPAPAAPTPTPAAAPAPADAGTPAAVSITFPSSPVRYAPTRPGTPASEALETAPVSDVTPASTYTVVSGENQSKIAKKTHTTQTELMKANHLTSSSVLGNGKKLIIPGKGAAADSAPASTEAARGPSASVEPAHTPAAATPTGPTSVKVPAGAVTHEVKKGETVGGIAKKYHVKVSDLEVANNIADPGKIFAGQVLVIPGGTNTSATRSSAAKPSAAAKPKPAVKPSPATPAGPAPVTANTATSAATPPPANAPDLDAGGKPQVEVPVIKVDDSSETKAP